jgi:hypothetical protein
VPHKLIFHKFFGSYVTRSSEMNHKSQSRSLDIFATILVLRLIAHFAGAGAFSSPSGVSQLNYLGISGLLINLMTLNLFN